MVHDAATVSAPLSASLHAWNGLDWALAALFGFSSVAGLLRGMIRTLFGVAGLFCGLALAAWQYWSAAEWVQHQGWIASTDLARGVCYVLIAALVMLGFGVAGALVRKTAHLAGLGLFDRLFGAVLGGLRGVLVGAGIVLAFSWLAPRSELLRDSQLRSYFLAAAHAVSFVVPHPFR